MTTDPIALLHANAHAGAHMRREYAEALAKHMTQHDKLMHQWRLIGDMRSRDDAETLALLLQAQERMFRAWKKVREL